MHIHHYTLQKIAALIAQRAIDGELVECFTQDKDQLVLGIGTPAGDVWVRVNCAPPLPYLWPVSNFHKAKRNVFDLFPELIGKRVTGVKTVDYDRVVILEFTESYALILKMHGIQSNVLLSREGKVVSIFRNSLENDFEFVPEPGFFLEEWREEASNWEDLPIGERLRKISPILDRNFEGFVKRRMGEGMDFVSALENALEAARDERFFILQEAKRTRFLPFDPEEGHVQAFDSLERALQVFFKSFFQYHSYASHYRTSERLLKKHLKRYNGQLNSFYESIEKIQNERPPEEIGHLIMANLHQIPSGQKKIELFDFYHDAPITVKLKPELNAQKNAEVYYQKQKKHRSRVKHLEVQIERLEDEKASFDAVEEVFGELVPPSELKLGENGFDYAHTKRINAFVKEHMALLNAGKPHLAEKKHPFHEFRKGKFTILVGKNARQNDALTFHFSHKNDLWLHARDVTGSHVIIRNSDNADIPPDVLEYAAGLAAHYSKRKREALVPVQYAERKYIRKLRGGAPGQVIVNREKVVMVEPIEG